MNYQKENTNALIFEQSALEHPKMKLLKNSQNIK